MSCITTLLKVKQAVVTNLQMVSTVRLQLQRIRISIGVILLIDDHLIS